MKVHQIASFMLLLFAFGMSSCQRVTLNEDQTDLLLTNMATYMTMLDELNEADINRLSYHIHESADVSPLLRKTHDQLKGLNEHLQRVSRELTESIHQNESIYFTDIQYVESVQLKQISQHISQFNDLVKPLSDDVYNELVAERNLLFEYLEGAYPAGVVDLAVMKYSVKIRLLMNHLYRTSGHIELTPNASINYTDPYFAIEIVPASNLLFAGDSLRFKLIDFTYFKAHPDSITFTYGGQDFKFGEHFAKIKDEIPFQPKAPMEKEIAIKTNYGLWLHGHSSFEYALVRDTLRLAPLQSCE